MQDKEIVKLYLSRDESAVTETQNKYDRYLTKIAYNILQDLEDCKESVNDTYLAAWNSIPPHSPENLATYLGKLNRRISIDIFRKRNAEKRKGSEYAVSISELDDCISGGSMPEDSIDEKLLAGAINEFLRTLSEEARNTFIGRYYFLDSVKDVAAYCGMSESKAKSMLFRTRCSLREYLIKEGFDL
ncbi:MAG: sigma-70 family RNA polymerase sigma factor [Lachnospiraceae bacterium]|nr:sigma-70 family RNA polymerase sigma factor [Lachnospiraceae bacterium]